MNVILGLISQQISFFLTLCSLNSSRRNPFTLLIATDDSHPVAKGELYWDDGKSIGKIYYVWPTVVTPSFSTKNKPPTNF